MKKLPFKKAAFITSALLPKEYPSQKDAQGRPIPEIAIIGRSNVGKSSLINHLLRTKTLAKVSAKPGKTVRINYFLIDETFYLVDLPGYGYAKVSKSEKDEWGEHLESYLNERSLKALIFLIDSRRALSEDDEAFLEWAKFKGLPLLIIVTKGDKLSKREKEEVMAQYKEHLSQYPLLMYSMKEGKCREHLISMICKALWD